ncbi:MAG TPA: PfkB family carbohydrate kinase [Ktedonobacteraceae bacterium]|nr:PfkB family carbohydrate kinase [Ktedonobacteraceae bacterium]
MSELAVPNYQLELADIDTRPLAYAEAEPEEESIAVVEAVVAGHICLDIIPTLVGDSLVFAPGRLIEAGKAILATGGPVSNTGLALHRLGVTTRLMGKLGDDLFGQAILSIIESYEPGLAGGMVIAPGEASSYSVIISPPGIDRTFIHAPGCNDTFGADDIRYDLLKIVRLFHFGYPPLMARMYRDNGAELASIFRQAKACGVTTSLDLSMPDPSRPSGRADWHAILAAALPSVDIFLPSIEELLFMLRRPLFDQITAKAGEAGLVDYVSPDIVSELGQTLLDMGAKIVGFKVGHRGLYLRTSDTAAMTDMGRGEPTKPKAWANRELWAPCFATTVVGTTGSGDATIAGFLLGLLRGMTPEATLSAACAVGACNVEAADAISGIRSWPETMERIATGWPRLMLEKKSLPSLDMLAFGWQWDEVSEVWVGPRSVL